MELPVSPASSLSVDVPITDSSVGETSWGSEHFGETLEFPKNSEKLDEESDTKSSTNLVEIGDRDKRPYEEFDEESDLKKPADSEEITGEDNDYERSDVPKLPEDYIDETNNNTGDEKMLQVADDFSLAGMENTFPGNISAEAINGDFCEDKYDVHQSENSEGKAQVEEVQTADDPERTESVQNEGNVMGVPIQDSEHEPAEVINGDCCEEKDEVHHFENSEGKAQVEEVQTADDPARTESVQNEDNVMGVPIQDSEHEPAEAINGDCCEDKDDVHQIENSEGKARVEEVQTADDPARTESVQNEDSVIGVPIQGSEYELPVAKSFEPDEVADQKSVVYTASGSENVDEEDLAKSWPKTESFSIDAESDNHESESREGEAKQFNANSGISFESSPGYESKTSSFQLDPGQVGDDVKEIQESTQCVVLEPVRTPEANSLLALKNNEDLNPESNEHATHTIHESDGSSIFRNGKDIMAESAEDAKFISTNTDEIFNQVITSIVDNSSYEPLGEPFHAGEAGDTGAVGGKNLEPEVINTEAVGEKNSESEVEGQDVSSAEEQGEEPKKMAEFDPGLTAGKEENFPFSPEKLPQVGLEVDNPDIQEMEENLKKISNAIKCDQASVLEEENSLPAVESGAKNTGEDSNIVETEPLNVLPQVGLEVDNPNIQEMEDNLKKVSNAIECDQASVVEEEDSLPVVESGAKNTGEDSKIVEPEPLNVAAGDQIYNDESILVKNEISVVAPTGNRGQQSESEIQIQMQAKEMTVKSQESKDQNRKDSENVKGTFLQRIWPCCGVLEWMRGWRD